jgi:hypothetical protein
LSPCGSNESATTSTCDTAAANNVCNARSTGTGWNINGRSSAKLIDSFAVDTVSSTVPVRPAGNARSAHSGNVRLTPRAGTYLGSDARITS